MEGQHPKPPRKPLTPYMRYSKSIWKSVKEAKDQIWQSVKEANPSLSVCEIGATIGKMWRELDDVTKQKYNEDFVQDKVRYDEELQAYLKMTGLQASDLAKPKSRKKAESKQSRANHQAPTPPPGPMNIPQQAMGMPQMPPPGYPGQAVSMQLPPNFPANSQASAAGALPHFSQIWTTGQFDGQGGQMMMLNAQGQPMQIPNGQAAAMAFFQPQLQQQLQQQAQQVQQQQAAEQQAQTQQEQQQSQQQQQPQQQQQQASDQIPSYNGSPQMPAAAGSPHLNTASPLSQEQGSTSVPAPPTYEQQLRDKVQQQAQQQQLDQWALHQQVLAQQQQASAQQLAVQQGQPSSNGSEPKASPQSHTTDPNSPVATATAENSSEQKHIGSPTGDSNSASSATTNTDAQVTSQQMPPQYASAHNNFNSYANFPWGNFPQAVQAQLQAEAQAQAATTSSTTTPAAVATDSNGKPVFSKESILESELSHLRTALSEQTKEVQRLSQELEKAYSVIEQLKVDRAQLQAQYNAQAQAHAHVQAQAQAHMQQVQAQAQAHAQAAHAAQSAGPLALTMQSSPQDPPSSSPGPM